MADVLSSLEEARIIAEARSRVAETDAYQAALVSRYRKYHSQYAPFDGDQWPTDGSRPGRSGKIHITSNLIKPAVNIPARLEAKLPRITLKPTSTQDEAERIRAETAEKSVVTWLEASDWHIWMHDLTRGKHLYGKGVLKVFWNSAEKRPDVSVVENPANLRVGWGSSDFRQIDWALYEYSLSPFQIMRRWPQIGVLPAKEPNGPLQVIKVGGDHSDPLGQRPNNIPDLRPVYQPSDYERKQVKVWDYWYKDSKGKVYNCIIVGERVEAERAYHRELADIPYIVIENDHEPGSPEGISSIADLLDLQEEINRLLSMGVQLIVDNLDPAWQVDDDSFPAGRVPKAGEIIPAGEGKQIRAIEKPVNTFPVEQVLDRLLDQYHRVSGLSPIMFGDPSGSQVSGRALAVMMDAYANRGDPRRDRLYAGLKELIIFWSIMVERLNPKVAGRGMKPIFDGLRAWTIVGPEITPKDVIEATTNEINKVNAKIQSRRSAMDNLGIDSPEDELDLIAEELSDLQLNPAEVQLQMAVYAALQQLGLSADQLQGALNPNEQQAGQGAANIAQQQAQPALTQDQNEAGAQPATAPGGAPGGGPLGLTVLNRTNAQQQPQALTQLRREF